MGNTGAQLPEAERVHSCRKDVFPQFILGDDGDNDVFYGTLWAMAFLHGPLNS